MPDLAIVLVFPVVAGVIVVLVEYFVVQPIKKATERAIPSSSEISKDWATAMKKAIKRFRAQYYGAAGQWWPRPHETIVVEKWRIEKGRATLTLALTKMVETFEYGILDFYRIPRVIAKHELTIDRTGDILEIRLLSFEQIQATQYPAASLRETTLRIKKRKPPRIEKVQNGVNVILEFEVENTGKAGLVCPYIEFQVVTAEVDGKYAPKKFNTKPKPFAIDALTTQPFKFKLFFKLPELPLVEPPHKVTIELHPCPKTGTQ
jgi:hypothetical protein